MDAPKRRVVTPRVRLLRDVRGERMSLRQLEHATGISRASLSQIENGLRCPTSRQARLIAAVLGVDAARLAVRAFLVVEEHVP